MIVTGLELRFFEAKNYLLQEPKKFYKTIVYFVNICESFSKMLKENLGKLFHPNIPREFLKTIKCFSWKKGMEDGENS